MSVTNGNGHKPRKGNGNGQGRTKDSTEIATIDLKAEALALFFEGNSVAQIAEKLNRSEVAIYGYINGARLKLIKEKKEHFEERLAILLDDSLDVIATQSRLLNDADFLKTAEPERIDSISRATGILFDKCFVLLAGWGNKRAQSTTEPLAAPAGVAAAE